MPNFENRDGIENPWLWAMILILLSVGLLFAGGCASPCMKKTVVLEQKQCKWERRQNRDIGMFVGAGMVGIVLAPFIAGHVLGKGDAPKWLPPVFGVTWAVGMFGAMDGSTWIGPYPREKQSWEKKK